MSGPTTSRSVPGFEVEDVDATQHFEAITSPDNFIVKEGFDDFRENFCPEVGKLAVSKTFSWLVETRPNKAGYRWHCYKEPDYQPLSFPGIIIAQREELGIPEHADIDKMYYGNIQIAIQYAIQAGSIVRAAAPIRSLAETGLRRLQIREEVVFAMAAQLHNQFS